jgi:sugar/nucleoside kinase (ribokinase family)
MAFDSVKTPYGKAHRVLGGSLTYFSIAASYFTDVAVVAVVGEDFTDEHFAAFREKGIDTRQVNRVAGKSFYWAGEYNENLNERTTLATELNVFADFRPDILPAYRRHPYLFLGNIEPELQIHVLDQMEQPKLVALDTMNYWIESRPEALAEVLRRVDVLLINDEEARMLSGHYNLVQAAEAVQAMGPDVLIIKRGEHGATVFMPGEYFLVPAYPLRELSDPTGAGDCFAGGFMGYLAGKDARSNAEIRQATIYGTIMASFDVEKFSVDGIRSLTFPEIQARYEEFLAMTGVHGKS